MLLITLVTAWGCGTVPTAKERKGPPKIALVLGGGAARGFAHVGVIRVLEQEKIPINMIVGHQCGQSDRGHLCLRSQQFQPGMAFLYHRKG